jgi:four helix bundle protein
MQNAECKVQNDGQPAQQDLDVRTKRFALRVIRLYAALPKSNEAQVIGKQLLRSGTSVGAQYCEAECARSIAEFISKLGGARQESRETMYWLELLMEARILPHTRLADLYEESKQLFAMLTASINTAKRRRK